MPESHVAQIVVQELRGNPNSTKHLMSKLGWSKLKAKWGGKDYSRAIWVEDKCWIQHGKIKGPDGYSDDLANHVNEFSAIVVDDVPRNDQRK